MPTILDAGTVTLSNADVLHWIKAKRQQHATEEKDDKAAGRKNTQPSNFLRSLRKHERELQDPKFPYIANPGAYADDNRSRSIAIFVERCDVAICDPLESQFREQGLTGKELRGKVAREQEKKGFSPAELLMIQNLAPENVTLLEILIEDWQDRFTPAEMEVLSGVVNEVFRCGEQLPEIQS